MSANKLPFQLNLPAPESLGANLAKILRRVLPGMCQRRDETYCGDFPRVRHTNALDTVCLFIVR